MTPRTPRRGLPLLHLALGLGALGASALLAPACSTLGTRGGEPEGLPHNGTGPFRDLDATETGIRTPRGAALSLSGVTVDTAMVASDGSLFYGAATFMAGGGMPDAGVADDGGLPAPDAGSPTPTFGAPDWSRHAPRAISRSAPTAASDLAFATSSPGFAAGAVILEASHAWEGGYVSDPWALVRADGSVLLYYAAAGGVGVATAPSVAGPYTASASPVLPAHDGHVPRRPSAIDTALLGGATHAILVYYEEDGAILVAGSSDGLALTPIGPVALPAMPARDDRDGDELEIGGPGALVVTSPARRSFVRLYYESRRSNGNTLLTLAASADGASFESFGRPVVEARDRRAPSAYELDDRLSLLYQWSPDGPGTSQGTVFVGIAPGGIRLAPEM